MKHVPSHQIVRDHPLTKLLWEPLRRSMLAVRAAAPSKPRTEAVNEAASLIFDDPEWRSVIERELIRPRQYAPEDAFDWLCYLGQQIWPHRFEGRFRVEVQVTRRGLEIRRVLPPRTPLGNKCYEQRLVSRSE